MGKLNRVNRPNHGWHAKPLTPEAIEGFKSKDSRPQRRRRKFEAKMEHVNVNFGFEPRHARRGIARTLAKQKP